MLNPCGCEQTASRRECVRARHPDNEGDREEIVECPCACHGDPLFGQQDRICRNCHRPCGPNGEHPEYQCPWEVFTTGVMWNRITGERVLPSQQTVKATPETLARWAAHADALFEASQGAGCSNFSEAICERCGRDNIVWYAPNDVWNRVMPDDGGILCPVCFVQAAEQAGIAPTVWRLIPAEVKRG